VRSHYLSALYWAFTTMTTVGYGDIVPFPFSQAELVVTFISQVSATTLFAYVIGALVSLVLNLNPGEKNRKAAVMEFNVFLGDLTLTSKQTKMLRRQYNHRIQMKPVYLQEQEDLLWSLPVFLRIKVVYFLYRQPIKRLPALAQLERQYRGFLAIILPKLKPCLFSAGEQIVTQYICAREMYFVLRGKCRARYTSDNSFYRNFEDYEFFAEATLMIPEDVSFRLSYSVKALTRAHIYAMPKQAYDELEAYHPMIAKRFVEQIISHESKAEVSVIPFVPNENFPHVVDNVEKPISPKSLTNLQKSLSKKITIRRRRSSKNMNNSQKEKNSIRKQGNTRGKLKRVGKSKKAITRPGAQR